jgi:DNA polymerase-3 subunit epsilon
MDEPFEFAVLDVETTGFSTRLHDRIVEVGIIRVDSRNNIIREYGTLINPQRDIGATHIHGIRASDVCDAPLFEEVVGDVQEMIQGAIIVAHNASFDLNFLAHHCESCKAPLPTIEYLCTLQLAKLLDLDVPNRKLGTLCAAYGIPTGQAHSALDDARATAALLGKLLENINEPLTQGTLGLRTLASAVQSWTTTIPSGKEHRRSAAAASRTQKQTGWLSRLFDTLPVHNDTNHAIDEYLAVLELALEDRMITDEEVVALGEVAKRLDMDRDEVEQAHVLFLGDVIHAAWADKIITESEQYDIEQIATLLGIAEQQWRDMIEAAKAGTDRVRSVIPTQSGGFEGKSICFTGSFNFLQNGERVTRQEMETIAGENGMCVQKGVTKSLDILVCADPDTMSNKGKKAREYGVRIIAEPAFFKMLGQ